MWIQIHRYGFDRLLPSQGFEEGCLTCDACEEAAPEVFEVTDDTCFIKSDVRLDGGFDRNDAKSGLKSEVIQTFSDDILDAADGCPVDVIIVVEAQTDEVAPEVSVVEADTEETTAIDTVPSVAVNDGLEAFLTTGDRTLNIFLARSQETLSNSLRTSPRELLTTDLRG